MYCPASIAPCISKELLAQPIAPNGNCTAGIAPCTCKKLMAQPIAPKGNCTAGIAACACKELLAQPIEITPIILILSLLWALPPPCQNPDQIPNISSDA